MKNLYRRYRPLKLADVVGQEQVTKVLEGSLKQGKINHAYLFVGPRGTGKTSVARIFAHEVNGFEYKLEDDYIDIVEIDGASNRGIDNIRELREKAMIAPTSGKYKIYIIDEVHMLTKEAFNALLKILEEPPEHVIFMMATTDAYKVPPTITSRSQIFTFKLAEHDVMLKYLRSVADKEKIKISDEAIQVIVKRGGGSFRDSLSLLDQISTLSDKEITREMVISAMGLPEDEKIRELIDVSASHDVVKITTVIKELLMSGVKAETVAEEMIAAILDAPRPELISLLARLAEVKEPFAEARLLVALISFEQFEYDFSGCETPTIPHSGSRRSRPSPRGERANSRAAALRNPPSRDIAGVYPTTSSFDWTRLIEKAESVSEVIYKQLQKCEYEVRSGCLHLYPRTKIIKNILETKNNKKNLLSLANGMEVEIHEAGEHPESAVKDETLAKISDIMGGEVINDGGKSPF